MHFKCVAAKEDVEQKMAMQCWNCQKWNDHKTYDCKSETKCVICAGNHRKSECKKQKTEATCANCNGSHAAWSTDCPTYRSEIEKKKSFSSVASDAIKTPSFIAETIQPLILGVMEMLKKQIAIIIAEVVSKALLEHVYYEAESKKTNGATHHGTKARITSIVKMATQSVNMCPLHETDNTTVDKSAVQTEVMSRLQCFISPASQSQSMPNTKDASSSKS